MGVLNPNSTDYVHPNEPNLLDLTTAMTYDPINGEPHLRVTLGSDTITITGDVNLIDNVRVNNSTTNPVPVLLTNTSSTVYQGTTPWTITGTVNIGTMPEVEIKNNVGNPIPVSGTVTANVTFPSIYKVSKNTSDNTASNAIAVEISTGNGLVVSGTNALPTRVLNDEALIAYARGAAVTEAEVLNAYLIDKSGATSTLGTTPATMTTVWSYTGLFPWTTFAGSGDKLYIKSLTDDPKVRNKSIKIEGLDSNYNILIEEVAFGSNTAVAVSTTNNFYRINRIYLTGNNTNSLPQTYDIEVRYGSTSGTIVSYLTAPWARGQTCCYTVPAGYEAFLLSLNGNSGKDDEITSSLWVRTFNGTWELKKSFKFISGLFDHNFRTPLRIPEKSDVEIRAFALVESSSIGTEFQILVIPKP